MVKALEKTNTKGSGFSAFCKKVPKCESQTSSGEMADLSDYAGKTIRHLKVNQLGHWSSAPYRASILHDRQYSANINAAKCAGGKCSSQPP